MAETKAVEKQTLSTVSDLLNRFKGQIANALPRHITPERMIRVGLTAISRTPKLLECDPLTICSSIVQASILGLEPNSALGECHLVPFWNSKANRGRGGHECQLIIGYAGKLKMVANTEQYVVFSPKAVHLNDEFTFEVGTDPKVTHRPNLHDRGPIIGYWGGAMDIKTRQVTNLEYLSRKEAEEHGMRFSKSRNSNELAGPWLTDFDAMALKTVIHMVCKYLPKSSEQAQAWALDEASQAGMRQTYSEAIPEAILPEPEVPTEQPERHKPASGIKTIRQAVKAEVQEQEPSQPLEPADPGPEPPPEWVEKHKQQPPVDPDDSTVPQPISKLRRLQDAQNRLRRAIGNKRADSIYQATLDRYALNTPAKITDENLERAIVALEMAAAPQEPA